MYLNLKRRQRPEDLLGDEKGFTPATFVSSRERQRRRLEGESDVPFKQLQQRPEDFMDEDDGLLGRELQARKEYDTSTASGEASKYRARRVIEGSGPQYGSGRQHLIPGPIPNELVVAESEDHIGKRLLKLMGWREGHGIGTRRKLKGEDAPESIRKMFPCGEVMLAPEAIEEVPVPPSKNNAYGVGFDPHRDAPEFAAFASTQQHDKALVGRLQGGRRHEPDGYRISDVVDSGRKPSGGMKSGGISVGSSSIHPTAQGFALDDAEDDVYEGHVVEYDDSLTLPPPMHSEDSSSKYRLGRTEDGPHSVSSVQNKVMSWTKKFTENEVAADRRSARCPSDGRLPLEGFVVGSSPVFILKVWKLPFPPPDFSAHHTFNEAHPAESELKRLRESIWGKGSESVRLKGISVAYRAAMLGERAAPPPPPLASFRAAAFENMRAAMASRFTSASSGDGGRGKGPSTGGTAAPHGDLGGRLPGLTIVKSKEKINSSSQVPSSAGPTTSHSLSISTMSGGPHVPTVEKPTVARQPVRSTSVWRPCPLLCKRLNVPVPETSKAVGWGRQGEELPGTSTSSSTTLTRDILRDVRHNERGPLVGGGGGGSVTSKHEAAVINSEPDSSSRTAKPMDSTATITDKSMVDVELANRPEIDLFKSIFEADSDVESNRSCSDNSTTHEKGNDNEVRMGSSTLQPPVILPQWSSAAAAIKGEETSSTTTSSDTNQRYLIKGHHSSSPTRKKKSGSSKKDSKKTHKKERKKRKKKKSRRKHHRSE